MQARLASIWFDSCEQPFGPFSGAYGGAQERMLQTVWYAVMSGFELWARREGAVYGPLDCSCVALACNTAVPTTVGSHHKDGSMVMGPLGFWRGDQVAAGRPPLRALMFLHGQGPGHRCCAPSYSCVGVGGETMA